MYKVKVFTAVIMLAVGVGLRSVAFAQSSPYQQAAGELKFPPARKGPVAPDLLPPGSSIPREVPVESAGTMHIGAASSGAAQAPQFHDSKVLLHLILCDSISSARVLDFSTRQVVGNCSTSCDLVLTVGDYIVEAADKTSMSDHTVRLREATSLAVSPSRNELAYFGIAMGVVGAAVATLAVFGTFEYHCADGRSCEGQGLASGGIAMLGVAVTIPGWVLLGTQRHPRFDEDPVEPVQAESTLRVTAGGSSADAAAGVVFVF